MAIRLFFTNWSMDGNRVVHPITQWIEEQEGLGNSVPPFAFIQNYYPTPAANGQPDKTMVLVMIKGEAVNIEQYDNITGVYMLDPNTYSQPMTNPIRNKFKQKSDVFGIPSNLIDDATTVGEAVDMVIRYMEPASSGMDPQFAADNDAEFG